MKDGTRIFILSIFVGIWICKPIPYETLAYRIHQRQETVSKVLAVAPGGGKGSESTSFLQRIGLRKRKKFDLAFHRRLEKHFPDWDERMNYQKEREEVYKSVMIKKREIANLRIKESRHYYTKKELDAIDYFQGKGFYKEQQDPKIPRSQDPKVKPNKFDTRQSFLFKMHDPVFRENFLNSFNRRNN